MLRKNFCYGVAAISLTLASAASAGQYGMGDYPIYDDSVPSYHNYGGTEGSPAQMRLDRARKFNKTLGTLSLGGELAAGFRSEYIYRGFDVGADSCWDVQGSIGLAINDKIMVNFGAYALKAMAGSQFSDAGLYGDMLVFLSPKTTLTFGIAGHNYSNSYFSDGADIAFSIRREIFKNIYLKGGGLFDTGQDGWYFFGEAGFSPKISERARLNFSVGISSVSNYLWRNGYNDTYLRGSLSYALTNNITVEPFIGASFIEEASRNHVYGGASIQFNF